MKKINSYINNIFKDSSVSHMFYSYIWSQWFSASQSVISLSYVHLIDASLTNYLILKPSNS